MQFRVRPKLPMCLKTGLQALGSNSSNVEVTSTRSLKGSVDIDTCLKRLYPNDSRWDYVFGYKNRVYYVEVHQGKTSEVEDVVIAKVQLAEDGGAQHSAADLEDLKDRSTYHWISTKGTDTIRKRSRHRRMLDQNGMSMDQVLD